MRRTELRFYDIDTIDKIQLIARKLKVSFPYVCIKLCNENVDRLYAKVMENKELSESLINDLVDVTKESNREVLGGMKDVKIYSQIQTKLLSVIYNVILQTSNGEKVDSVAIDGGMFDELPERFSDMLDLLIIQRNGQA